MVVNASGESVDGRHLESNTNLLFVSLLYHHGDGRRRRFWGQVFAAMNNGLNRVFFRETVEDSGVGEGKVIRQRGGVGVYAHARVAVHALSRGRGKVFAWNAGWNIPAKFLPAVAQGVQDAMNAGVLAELELIDVHASVEDGSYLIEHETWPTR